MRILLTFCFIALLAGCATPAIFSGHVSSRSYLSIDREKSFLIVPGTSGSIAEREIESKLADAMISQGHIQAAKPTEAEILVVYSMSIGAGRSKVTSNPDFVWGGQEVSSYTHYPRQMQVMIYDVKGIATAEEATLLWQAEISSEGSSNNYISVGEEFIQIIFENYGQTNINDGFYKVIAL